MTIGFFLSKTPGSLADKLTQNTGIFQVAHDLNNGL